MGGKRSARNKKKRNKKKLHQHQRKIHNNTRTRQPEGRCGETYWGKVEINRE